MCAVIFSLTINKVNRVSKAEIQPQKEKRKNKLETFLKTREFDFLAVRIIKFSASKILCALSKLLEYKKIPLKRLSTTVGELCSSLRAHRGV
jgi:hypothetical protein